MRAQWKSLLPVTMMDLFLSNIFFLFTKNNYHKCPDGRSLLPLKNYIIILSLPSYLSISVPVSLNILINFSIHWPVSESMLWDLASGAASPESWSNSVLWSCSPSFTKHHISAPYPHPQCSWFLQMFQYKECSDYLPRHQHWPQFCWIRRIPRREKGYYRPNEMSGF